MTEIVESAKYHIDQDWVHDRYVSRAGYWEEVEFSPKTKRQVANEVEAIGALCSTVITRIASLKGNWYVGSLLFPDGFVEGFFKKTDYSDDALRERLLDIGEFLTNELWHECNMDDCLEELRQKIEEGEIDIDDQSLYDLLGSTVASQFVKDFAELE